jgi:hypothetical protein
MEIVIKREARIPSAAKVPLPEGADAETQRA